MANGITLSAGVRANLLSLQNTAQLMQTTQNRLATGKKVNSALDNPINFFTSQSLQSRAGDLNSLLDSMSNGIQTIQAANNGLTSITSTVQSMQSTLNQALQDSTWQSASYKIDSTSIGSTSLKNLSFSGGAVGDIAVDIAVNGTGTVGSVSTLTASSTYLAPSVADPASVESGTFTGLSGGGSYTFKVNGQDITLTDATSGSQAGNNLANAKASIQSQLDARFGAGSFTVGDNTAGDGFSISGKADGTNDVVISAQAATGGTAVPASRLGTAFTGLGTGQTYTFDFTSGTTTEAIELDSTTGATITDAVASIQDQLDTAFGAGNFTVTDNAGAIEIEGLANGSNSFSISNQAAAGAAVQASAVGGAYTGLGVGETYTFDVGDGATSTTISLDNTTGNNLANAISEIQDQLDTAFGAGNFTVTNNGTGFTISGLANGSNDVIISNQGAAGGTAAVANLGLGTTTTTSTGFELADAANLGLGTTTQNSNGVTTAGTTGLGLGTTTNPSYGTPADPYELTINGTAVTVAAGTGLTAAVSSINTQLGASHKFEAFDNAGSLGFREKAAEGTTLTIGGADASMFAATTNTGVASDTAAVKTVDELVAAINGHASLTGKVKASNDNGSLRITNLSTSDLTVVGATSTQVNGGTAGTDTQTIGGNTARKGYVQQFNMLRDQLDKYASDASFSGINLLMGDNLKLTLNETGSSTIDIQAKDANGNTLAINSGSLGISQAADAAFDSNSDVNAVLGTLKSALSTLRSQGSALGSNLSAVQNRQDFTKSMINTLQTGADNLVLADTNEEGANLLALQTRQSLSTTALSLSAQADQAVLSLFG